MKLRSVAATALVTLPTLTYGQLPSELATLACKPAKENSSDLIIEKSGHEWQLSMRSGGVAKPILRSAVPISNAQHAGDSGYVAYFLVNDKYPKQSGWVLQRLGDGRSMQILEAQLAPIAACITPDAHKLAYVTQTLAAVQIELAPAIERFRYWDDPAPKDHVVVPAPNGG